MSADVRFIFFDLGKVLVEFDHSLIDRNLATLTGLQTSRIHEIIFDSGLQNDYECGIINSQQFSNEFNLRANCNVRKEDFLNAISDIFTLNRSMACILTQLSAARFPIGVLSNTCEAHWEFINENFPIIRHVFPPEHNVLSFRAGSMKPDPAIYACARSAAEVSFEQIFFCDDLQQNVEGAVASAMQAKQFVSASGLIKELFNLGVKFNL